MNRCVQSGLWVADASTLTKEENDDEESTEAAKAGESTEVKEEEKKSADTEAKEPTDVKKKVAPGTEKPESAKAEGDLAV